MANPHKGKFFTTLYLVIFILVSSLKSGLFVNSSSVSVENEHENVTVSDPYQIQLQKLEQLVRNLTEIVDRLESRILGPPTPSKEKKLSLDNSGSALPEQDNNRSVKEVEDDGIEGKAREKSAVMKYNPIWSERFQFVSAVKLDSDVTCNNVLPFRDYEGLSKYFAVGDQRGRVYVFLRNGDVSVEFYTNSESPITAMLSYMSVYKNESLLVTGHKNGMILMHRVWEVSNGEELSLLSMENVGSFEVPGSGEGDMSVTILEVHHVGRMRYILSTDVSGKIRVYRENGTLSGIAVPTSKPLVFLKQRLLFLTESGAGSLDLRTMKVRESECEGLNHSLVRNYVFDAAERSKAYGFTSDSDLIQVLLLGDIMNFKCRVRSKRKFEMDDPVAFQAIRGYLLVINQKKVFVFNVSSQHYRIGAPRLLFNADYDEIRSSFLNYQVSEADEQRKTVIPLIASDREKLVVLGLGDGYVGMYRSNLPIYKGESNTILWTSPVLLFVIFLFGAWHFFAKKKEVLTSWGPDDPFSSASVTNGAPLGPDSSRDRSFAESSRNSDIMDLRGGGGGAGGGGLRGPSRRYPSPTRYPTEAANSYRPTPADHNSRPASAEPNFRTTSELKFRGTNIESTGFPKRRESLFPNSQVVTDSN